MAKLSLPNADLGEHTFFYSEAPRPQDREECDLCNKARSAVKDHITERTGP